MDEEKQCKRCLDWWPNDLEFYHRDRQNRDGLTAWCRACWSEYQHGRRVAASTSGTRGTAGDPSSVYTNGGGA